MPSAATVEQRHRLGPRRLVEAALRRPLLDLGARPAHMTGTGGGAFYEARSTATSAVEQCLICHGKGTAGDIGVVHRY